MRSINRIRTSRSIRHSMIRGVITSIMFTHLISMRTRSRTIIIISRSHNPSSCLNLSLGCVIDTNERRGI